MYNIFYDEEINTGDRGLNVAAKTILGNFERMSAVYDKSSAMGKASGASRKSAKEEREAQIEKFIREGYKSAEIAEHLGVSESTIRKSNSW